MEKGEIIEFKHREGPTGTGIILPQAPEKSRNQKSQLHQIGG